MSNEKKLISSHIFIFPFKWDYINKNNFNNESINKRIDLGKFKTLLGNNGWEEDNYNLNNDIEYNQYVYFYDSVRQAIYNTQKDTNVSKIRFNRNSKEYYGGIISKKVPKETVDCFKYNGLDADSKYNIKLNNDKEYSLKLKDVKLKIYNTGVGTLTYFLENYDTDITAEDILKINDFGRRIYPQYLPVENCKNSFLAKKLSLKLALNKSIEEDFIYEAKKYPTRISNTIMKLLGENFVCDKTEIQKGKIYITPVIDDRMFVMSLYRSNIIGRVLSNFTKEEHLENNFWYKYIFVDNSDATCQDKEMFRELLKESTYTRWKNYGTFFGVSRYSFVMVKKEPQDKNNGDFLLDHFNTMYYEMVSLALIQRASILRFSNEASQVSGQSDIQALKNIKELQKHYIQFINKIYFREVTAQEQGIEIYNKLLEMMKIERDVKRLDDEIDEIHKYTSLVSTGFTNNLLRLITYVTASIAISSFVSGLYKISKQENLEFIPTYRLAIITIVAVLLVIIVIEKLFKYNKKKWIIFIVTLILILSYIVPIHTVDNNLWRLVPWLS